MLRDELRLTAIRLHNIMQQNKNNLSAAVNHRLQMEANKVAELAEKVEKQLSDVVVDFDDAIRTQFDPFDGSLLNDPAAYRQSLTEYEVSKRFRLRLREHLRANGFEEVAERMPNRDLDLESQCKIDFARRRLEAKHSDGPFISFAGRVE